MKIVFNVSAMNSGGAERVVSLLSDELCKRGHEVSILMLSTDTPYSFYSINPRVALIPLLSAKKKCVRFFERVKVLKKFYKKNNPDVVIAFLPHVCIYTYFALKKAKIPFILSERNDPNQYSFIYKKLLRKAFDSANGCVFQTSDCLDWYRKGKRKINDRVIFNPINIPTALTANVNFDRKKNVLFVSRFDKQKNYPLLLKSFQIFSLNHQDFVLDVYGDGPEKHQFFELAKNLNVLHKINYHGKRADWQFAEFNSSLFASTSIYEGMPNSLAEAATLNIPCVATNCPIGGSKELHNVFDNILLVENNCSEQTFSAKMEEALRLPHSTKAICKKVCLSYVADEWEQILKEVING